MRKALILIAVATAAWAGAGSAGAREGTISGSRATERAQAPTTLTVRATRFGRILFDGRGRVLYGFSRDRRGGPSQCYGPCAAAWPVYFSRGAVRAGTGVKQAQIGTTRRRDGRLQITYNGWPLYYYVHDGVGEVRCQNVDEFGGLWLVVRPAGTLVR